MPLVHKQTMKKPVKRANRGSVLDGACDIGELPRSPRKILLYGPNRAGKTY